MLSFLLACLPNNLSGGGGGGPFVLTAATLSTKQSGTSCVDPFQFWGSVSYTGSVSGITLEVEESWDGAAFSTVATGLTPLGDFPYVLAIQGYANKFGQLVGYQIRVTDESDPTNTVTSTIASRVYTRCDA